MPTIILENITCIVLFNQQRTFTPTNATSSRWHKDASDAFAEESPCMLSPMKNQNTFQGHNSVPTPPLDTGEFANVTSFHLHERVFKNNKVIRHVHER